jgi:hypothetical protein
MDRGPHPLRPILQALAAIEEAFLTELRMPEDRSTLPIDAILMLGTGIQKGRFRRQDESPVSLVLDEAEAARFTDAVGTGSASVSYSFEFKFLGFTTETVNVVFERPMIQRRATEMAPESGMVEIEINAERTIYEFERWIGKA